MFRCREPNFILGVMIFSCIAWSPHTQVASKMCKSFNISAAYHHCQDLSGGVRHLDCFGTHPSRGRAKDWKCVWEAQSHASNTTYTLVVEQKSKSHCEYWKVLGLSRKITLFESDSVTAQVFLDNGKYCSKATFTGLPTNLVRCGPPLSATFRRHSAKLQVNVSWRPADERHVERYYLSLKAEGEARRTETVVRSPVSLLDDLNPSLAYAVQIQCITNEKCTKCPPSDVYTVPPELTLAPVIDKVDDSDIVGEKGRRLLSVTWKLPLSDQPVSYRVSVAKVSGENPREERVTTEPEIRLILSHSAFHLQISAFSNTSTSPAVHCIIPARNNREDLPAGELNVTLSSNSSLTLHWKDDLIQNYSCFCVEWGKVDDVQTVSYKSFCEDENNYKSFDNLGEALEPYTRYSIMLHTRPNEGACNLKRINNSESTYGYQHFYFIEGAPLSAPVNITVSNLTHNSAVLQWSPIPEDNLRGFLRGYIINYTIYQMEKQNVIIAPPDSNTYELKDLKGSTVYQVQMSGFTQAGAGVQSPACLFETQRQDSPRLGLLISAALVVASVLVFGSPLMKRAKVLLWPTIPTPQQSKAMQKVDANFKLGFLIPRIALRAEG